VIACFIFLSLRTVKHRKAAQGHPLVALCKSAHAASTCRSTITGSVNANIEPWPGCDSSADDRRRHCSVLVRALTVSRSNRYSSLLSNDCPNEQ
jgi:hypothetical protein